MSAAEKPPRWDNLPVTWTRFQPRPGVFTCNISEGPAWSTTTDPEEPCDGCGTTARKSESIGTIAAGRPRNGAGIALLVPEYSRTLTMHRCTRCGFTTVQHGTNLYELDASDYSPEGSHDS